MDDGYLWMDRRMDKWVDGWVDGEKDWQMNGQINGYMGYMEMDGQTDAWRDGWIPSSLAFLEFSILLVASPSLASEHLHPHEQGT